MVKLTKIKKYRAIKWYVNRGYGANEIQRRLKARGLGIRRKILLTEVRTLRKETITREKRIKHIPKKYRRKEVKPRKKWIEKVKIEAKQIFRISLIIPSLPVHSRAFKRNYLGFRLNAFGFDKDYLFNQLSGLREILIKETGKYIGSMPYAREQVIRVEKPVLINVLNPNYLNGKWFFAVEKEGKEQYGTSGNL